MVDTTSVNLTTVEFDPFAGPAIVRLIPITEPQAEIWVACLLGGNDANRAYNESISLRFDGPLDRAAIERAVQTLVRRHEMLRATFSADGKYICVFEELDITPSFQDISREPDAAKEQLVLELVRQDAYHLFDLNNGPLLKVSLVRLSDQAHHLTITAHHIICDGWSFGIILQDLGTLYSAYVQHRSPDLPSVALFSRYADEQLVFTTSDAYRRIEQFWMDQYRDGVPLVTLPTDFPRPAVRTFDSERLDVELEPELVLAIKKMGIRAGCSFVTTLLAAFEVFIQRLTGQDALIIGLPVAGQSISGDARLVGHCVNLLPLLSHPDNARSFTDFLKQRKGELFDAYEHQQLTFGSLLKKLNVVRDKSRVSMVPVVFNIDMGLADGVAFSDLDYRLNSNPRIFDNFELYLNATGTDKTLVLEWAYNTNLFKADTMARLADAFDGLLRQLVSNPDVVLETVPVDVATIYGRVTAVQTGKSHRPESGSPVSYPTDKTIVDLLSEQVKRTPEGIAITASGGQMTYEQLDVKSTQLAHYLRARGVTTETLVPICLDRTIDMIVGIVGILKAGGAYVPIDPDYPTDRIEYMLTDTRATVIITDSYGLERLPTGQQGYEIICLDKQWDAIGREATEPVLATLSPSNLTYVIYTSGSTGRPKGVLIEHRNVVRLFMTDAPLFDFSADDVWTMFHSFCFDFSVWEMYGALFYGGRLVMVPKATAKDAGAFGELLMAEKVTVLNQTPSAFYVLQDYLTSRTKTVPIRYVIFGGEALAPAKLRRWHNQYPASQLINMYGITETTVHVTYQEISPVQMAGSSSVIGTPIPTLSVLVLNENGQVVPAGTEGELYVGGAGLARGYLNLPDLTAQRFIYHPSGETTTRLYRSGDLARHLPDGTLEYLGRIDDQVKIRGHRIELGEIESVLEQVAGVKQGIVIAKEEPGGDKRLVGFIVPEEKTYDKPAVIGALRSKLPDYMVPHLLMTVDSIPLTGNGKVDRKALAQLNPAQAVSVHKHGFMGPRTEAEKLVADIWAEYLGITEVDIFDDFFELGGHSLIAVQFMMQLERKTGISLPLSTLFEYSTISRLATLLTEKEPPATLKSLVPIKPLGNKPPVYVIHGAGLNVLNFIGIATHMDPNQPVYGLQAKGLDGITEAPDNIETIAADYVAEIVEQNPTGPYAIAGYSFGGYVGIEMARLLQQQGRDVKMLAMFDTNTENVEHQDGKLDKFSKRLARQVPKSAWFIKSLITYPLETLNYQLVYLNRHIRAFARAMGLRKEQDPEGMFAIMKYINERHDVALENYRMKPYDGPIDLFRADKRLYFVEDFAFLGWDRYALKGVRVHRVPGDHKSMLLPPNDKAFARILQKALDTAK